jgi:acyl-CoA synthetase (AMP-forming)/AMP-acid ligase II
VYPGAIAQEAPARPAIVMADTGAVTTYAELDAGANRLSRVLQGAGLRPGDHVAICVENHPRFFEVVWGCHYAGLVYTVCSTRLTAAELAYVVTDCGARAMVTSAAMVPLVGRVVADTPAVERRLMLDGSDAHHESYEAAVAAETAEPLPDRVEGSDMLYSSGTTGRPKGVAFTFSPAPLGTAPTLVTLCSLVFGMGPDTVYLSPAPLYHAAPLRFTMAVHRLGGTAVVMPHFDAETLLALVERHRVTATQVVPTMFVRMLKLPEESRLRHDVSSLRCVIHAAAPCPVEVKRAMIDWWGPVIHEYYAGTEGNGFVYCNSPQWLAHPGTVGTAISGILHVLDEAGDEVPVGETGTIYFESPSAFAYHNDPAKTAASRDPKGRGWTTLGDVGRLDADGFLYLTDRAAFMIITGGVNVYPQEAENALVLHPEVIDVAVFGVPHPEWGEEVKAVVQPRRMPADAADAGRLAEELMAWCRERLADVKCPRSVEFRAELPRHPTGKLYKRLLRDEYWAGSGRHI